jgi:hypothetical protein
VQKIGEDTQLHCTFKNVTQMKSCYIYLVYLKKSSHFDHSLYEYITNNLGSKPCMPLAVQEEEDSVTVIAYWSQNV